VLCNSSRFNKATRMLWRRSNERCNIHCMNTGARMLQSTSTMVRFTTRNRACPCTIIILYAGDTANAQKQEVLSHTQENALLRRYDQ
jgi:hypothetical protein